MIDYTALADFGLGWLEGSGPHADIVLSTRVRLARNIQGHAFSNRIREPERELIFEPFRRGNHAAAVGGVGIGLTLSRQLTEAMDGTIAVESTPGQGATFSVQLNGSATG